MDDATESRLIRIEERIAYMEENLATLDEVFRDVNTLARQTRGELHALREQLRRMEVDEPPGP